MYHGAKGGLASLLRFSTSTRSSPDMPDSLQCRYQCIMAVLLFVCRHRQLTPPLNLALITTHEFRFDK
jgi:hypothetical protein